MSTNADAAIIYGTLGQSVSIGTVASNITAAKTFQVSVVQKEFESIYLRRFSAIGSAASSANAKIIGVVGLATVGGATSGGGHAAKNFALNAPIGVSQHFSGHGGTFLEKHTSGNALRGFFGGDQTGFVGFSNGFGNYAWIRLSVSDAGSPGYTNELTVIDYAYNTVAGETIDAGEGIPTSTPEPSTSALGLLASGAAGIAVWRRRRKEVDAS
jgi:MYXO-CTERM domain-containing protein